MLQYLMMEQITDQIRQAIKASPKSRYRLSKESGVSEAHLSRLMSGERRLGLKCLERLADALELEITVRPKDGRKGG